MDKKFAYLRVSTKEQKEDRQVMALRGLEIPPENVYLDKRSGKDFERPRYKRLMRRLGKGDTLFIKSIDRLGRNYGEILRQWARITKEREADIVVLDMPLLDTRRKSGDLTGVFISDLVLQILSYVAQTERDFIKSRQREGIAAARAEGVKFGRSRMEEPEGFDSLRAAWSGGRISSRKAARQLNMSHSTFYRRCKETENAV